jgi:hypothetical protein
MFLWNQYSDRFQIRAFVKWRIWSGQSWNERCPVHSCSRTKVSRSSKANEESKRTMRFILRHQWLLLLALAAACAGPPNSRERLSSVLRERLGKAADPQVAFKRDSTHLLVQLDTVAFPTVSESLLTDQARRIAGFALRHYERANQLDSVTVLYRAPVSRGVWYIRDTRTFPIENLRNVR